MNGTPESINHLMVDLTSQALSDLTCEVIVFPPSLFIAQVVELAKGKINVGAQNVSEFKPGAYTGEIAAEMLSAVGCKYVIVGHSERRQLFAETNQQVAEKVAAALAQKLVPIVCVGETLAQKEQGETVRVIEQQLDAVLERCGIDAFADLVIAYEPVWAIGTGKTASPEQAQQVHAAIRQWLAQSSPEIAQKVRILYGGSVNADNASELFAQPDIDGGLIGGASLKAESFYRICQSAG
jgi:triosephosphate isomerase